MISTFARKEVINLDEYVRNSAFEEYQNILTRCVRRNLPLIMALHLEIEDVVQDLSIRMLCSVERYDETRCCAFSKFLYHELQHEILNMRRRHKPHGIVGVPRAERLDIVYLDHRENGAFFELPVSESFEECELEEALDALPTEERCVVIRKMNGEPIRKNVERQRLARARQILADYFTERKYEYA